MSWELKPAVKKLPVLKDPIFVEGLPGIGNVGKIAADFIIDEVGAKKLFDCVSYSLPNSVFVNEKNLVELPMIEVYYKKWNGAAKGRKDMLILTGDIQPTDEVSSYEFCEAILDMIERFGGKEIITIGGIGLADVPKKPAVYCTANNKKIIADYKKTVKLNTELYGIVGPIIGVTGLLVGLAEKRKIDAICLLAETLGHPAYLGIKGAREIIKVLNKRLKLGIKLGALDREVDELEAEIAKSTEFDKVVKTSKLQKLKKVEETSYIG